MDIVLNFIKYTFDFLNENIGIVTLVVGFSAIFLYLKQKRDYKRDVALLVRQEIRYAEQQVEKSRSFSQNAENYPLSIKLLPTNSWYKNIHLFINDFEQPQIDAISRFYAQIEYIDVIIEKISDYKNSIIQETLFDSQGKIIGKEDIISERVYLNEIERLLILQETLQRESAKIESSPQTTNNMTNSRALPSYPIKVTKQFKLFANNILRIVSSKVDFIYNTPIGEKFKEISEKKLFWFF